MGANDGQQVLFVYYIPLIQSTYFVTIFPLQN